jgi:hypothetical protein
MSESIFSPGVLDRATEVNLRKRLRTAQISNAAGKMRNDKSSFHRSNQSHDLDRLASLQRALDLERSKKLRLKKDINEIKSNLSSAVNQVRSLLSEK